MSKEPPPPPPLCKQRSWSPDMAREEAWLRRKGLQSKLSGSRRALSLTDDDLAELKACIELGFGFDSPRASRKLKETIPALELYYAVNKRYTRAISRSSSMCSTSSMSLYDEAADFADDDDDSSPLIDPCDDPKMVKARLKQWAQVVACAVREAASSSPPSNVGKQ